MIAALFSAGLLVVVLLCGGMAFVTWRDPNNWHLDGESGRVEFHRWLDVGIFGAIGAMCAVVALLPIAL